MISGILIFNQKGENLIFRAFRNDCRPRLADVFRIQVISNAQVRSPILTLGSTTFSHVKHENIYLVAVTKSNANAALVFEFLYRLVALGKGYFVKFDEEAVKNNFVLVYELLDEILDFGYPQNTETDTLKMYITTEGVKSERTMEDSSKITMQATGALSWRRSDVKYRKNEAFVDVIEDVNLLMSATGTVLRADVNGQIVMRAYLTGTPECKFGLNDRLLLENDGLSGPTGNTAGTKATKAAAGSVTLEDCQFHQCVKLGKFDSDRIISFIPPDGEFELMRYRATENVNLPFKVHAIVNELGKTKVEYSIAIKANYGSKLFATNVIVRVPTPLNTAKITERTSQGKAKYEPEHNNIIWKIPRFTGQSEYVLSAEATLTSMTNQKAWSRPPLSLTFSLLMFTSSGLLVRYLKVFEKGNYGSVKWVRYMTRAGSYEIRYHNSQATFSQQSHGERTILTLYFEGKLSNLKQSKNQPRLSLLSIIGKNITLSMKRKEPGVTEFVNMTIDRRVQSSRHVFTASATAVVPKEFIAPAKAVVPKEFIAPAKAVVPKQSSVAKALEVFPCYSLGRVYIHLDTNAQHSFQLHRAVLERQSTWFANEFARTGSIKEASRYRFFLTMSPKHKVALLVQTKYEIDAGIHPQISPALSSEFIPIVDLTTGDGYKDETASKQESLAHDITHKARVGNTVQQHQSLRFKAVHKWLLGMYYNIAPDLSATDIDMTLTECEEIINLATYYGSLPTIRPYLGNVLAQFRNVYSAIAKDPPRWLALSVSLQLGALYCEAMIHCAGAYPYSLWPTDVQTLPANLLTIIRAKANELAYLRSQVSIELHMNTLADAQDGLTVSLLTAPEAWLVVQMFRDWLAQQERILRTTNKMYDGRHFRKMHKGREAYLPSKLMVALFEELGIRGPLSYSWDAAEGDLNCLKDFAQQAVEQLAKNNLMISPEAEGIPYLTCVQVGPNDYPWSKTAWKQC